MFKKFFFPMIDTEVQNLIDEDSAKNIEYISFAIALFEALSLVFFVLSRRQFGTEEWISAGSVVFCAVTCFAGFFISRYLQRKAAPGHMRVIAFNTAYSVLLSVWSIWTSFRQYSRGEQILTFYALEIMLVCFVALRPWLSTILTAGVYAVLYWTLYRVDGAAGINTFNYVILAIVSIIGVTVRYHSLIRMAEATVRLQKTKESEVQDKMNILQAIADIYDNVNLIDFTENTEMSVRDNEHIKHALEHGAHIHTLMTRGIRERIMPDQLERFIEYTDIATVRTRLVDKKLISADFIDVFDGWIRAQYIPVDVDESGLPLRIIFTTRNVDDEKKREERLIQIAMTDELTRLYNRRSYEEDLAEYRARPLDEDLVVLSADVNGLKAVNDTIGHNAGDELIRGAANCLLLAVGNRGKVYRTGGDEFMAILHTDDPEAVRRDIERRCDKWHGRYSEKLSVSAGYAAHADHEGLSMHELEKKADHEMYLSKAKHYEREGIDRRHR